MKLIIAFLTLFICLNTASTQNHLEPISESVSAPYAEAQLVEDNGRILVQVSIAGHDSLIFILDTAAQGGVISPETRDLLGLDPASGQDQQVMGASGPTILTRMPLPPVTLAGETVDGLNAVVVDMTPFRRSPGPANLSNLAEVQGFVMFDVAVGDTIARAILDSGAHTSALNWLAAAGVGVTRETPGLLESSPAGGISGDIVETYSHRIDGIGVEGLHFPPLEISILNLPFGERPMMLLGADFLRECRVFISHSQQRVHLCGDAAG